MTTFLAPDGCTIFDICLNTYGSFDMLGKLMLDNNFPSVNDFPKAGQVFQYDETLVFTSYSLGSGKFSTRYTKAAINIEAAPQGAVGDFAIDFGNDFFN